MGGTPGGADDIDVEQRSIVLVAREAQGGCGPIRWSEDVA
jgi:hypothetical protein